MINKKIINLKNNEISLINGGDCLCICGAFNIQYSDDQSQAYISVENFHLMGIASYLQPSRSPNLAICERKCTILRVRSTCIDFNDDTMINYDAMPPSPTQKTKYFNEEIM